MKLDLGFYKGPIALLLYLIQRHEIDIMDVPIAKVADIYLKSLNDMKLDEIGEFLVLATILIMMKLRAILKKPEEEEEPISFYQIAEEYHKYHDVIDDLKGRAQIEGRFMSRPGEKVQDLPSFDSVLLTELLKEIERRRKIDIDIPEIKVDRVEIESTLEEKLTSEVFVELGKVFGVMASIEACIMLFIIILDWVMRQKIAVHQESPMAPVLLRRR